MLKIVNNTHSTPFLNALERNALDNDCISTNAIKVITRLQQAKFDAFLVGGAVRDMILSKDPKDFDIATNARPEDIRKIFKNSRIIGRRFQIVHIHFGREIIEVTTFRGAHNSLKSSKNNKTSAINAEGMLTRDNVFGTIEEDAERRDFTINALYYAPKQAKIYDFCDGLKDLESKTIKLIGDPDIRFKEDPVRILRAVRFSVKLDFSIHPDTVAGFSSHAPLLKKIPPARLFDESLKLYLSGNVLENFKSLQQYALLDYLLFNHTIFKPGTSALNLAYQAMINTDKRLKQNMSVTPAFLYAVFLWPSMLERMQQLESELVPTFTALHTAAAEVMIQQSLYTTIPKRFQTIIRDIWELQFRLPFNQGKKALKTFEHPKFRAGYDFLLLREESGEIKSGLGQWWTDFQNDPAIKTMVSEKAKDYQKVYHSRKRKPFDKKKSPRR